MCVTVARVIVYTAYLDDEKKQVLQLFGQRSGDIIRCHNNVLCDLPNDLENPAVLVTGGNFTEFLLQSPIHIFALLQWLHAELFSHIENLVVELGKSSFAHFSLYP